MQTNNLNAQELANLLDDPSTKILDTLDYGANRTYVLEWNNQDILVIADGSNLATAIYPCGMFDKESGGSVHDVARAIAADA